MLLGGERETSVYLRHTVIVYLYNIRTHITHTHTVRVCINKQQEELKKRRSNYTRPRPIGRSWGEGGVKETQELAWEIGLRPSSFSPFFIFYLFINTCMNNIYSITISPYGRVREYKLEVCHAHHHPDENSILYNTIWNCFRIHKPLYKFWVYWKELLLFSPPSRNVCNR